MSDQQRPVWLIADDKLRSFHGRLGPDRVIEANLFKLEAREDVTDFGGVIDRKHEGPFDLAQTLSHEGELIAIEQAFAVIVLAPEIRRVQIEQRLRGIIALHHLRPVQAFQHHAIEPLAGVFEDDLQPRQRPARPRGGRNAKDAFQLAAKAKTLKVEEPRRPLEIGEGRGMAGLEPLKLFAARDLEAHDFHQLGIVALQNPKQIDDLAIAIIGHFEARFEAPPQEYAAHTSEGLDIGFVVYGLHAADKPRRQVFFAAKPRGYGGGGFYLQHVLILTYAARTPLEGTGNQGNMIDAACFHGGRVVRAVCAARTPAQ